VGSVDRPIAAWVWRITEPNWGSWPESSLCLASPHFPVLLSVPSSFGSWEGGGTGCDDAVAAVTGLDETLVVQGDARSRLEAPRDRQQGDNDIGPEWYPK
jgi:hypothetical protein